MNRKNDDLRRLEREHEVNLARYRELSEQLESLRLVDRLLGEMSGRTNAELWTDEAVLSGVRWREVRAAAQAAVGRMGWSQVLRRS